MHTCNVNEFYEWNEFYGWTMQGILNANFNHIDLFTTHGYILLSWLLDLAIWRLISPL